MEMFAIFGVPNIGDPKL